MKLPTAMICRTSTPALACLLLPLLALSLALPARGLAPAPPRAPRHQAATSPPPLLQLHWVRQEAPLKPAWADQPALQFDLAYRPVRLGDLLFVGSSRNDSLTALDLDSGEERWRFFANGPLRLAPAVARDRVFVAADDGCLYCLEAATGQLLWKFRGGPAERLVLGNERLISTWPARGGPVVADGVVYFAAGIWPFMGIFLHALDTETGQVLWTNDGEGSAWCEQPHHADSFAGVAPQGSLLVVGDHLLVPSGRSVPACFDRRTGKLLHYRLSANSKVGGGTEVTASGQVYVNGGWAFDLATGASLSQVGAPGVFAGGLYYSCSGVECQAFDVRQPAQPAAAGQRRGWPSGRLPTVRSFPVPKVSALAQDGSKLFLAADKQVFAVPLGQGTAPAVWQAPLEGTPVHLLADAGRLVVTTRQGRIYCFGPGAVRPRVYRRESVPAAPADAWTEEAKRILTRTGVQAGYCLSWGVGSGRLIEELARQSQLRIIALDPDAAKVSAMREQLARQGVPAERVALYVGSWDQVTLPPYFASLMVSEDLAGAVIAAHTGFMQRAYASLRPYGGVACFPEEEQGPPQARPPGGRAWTTITRAGALPGASDWTHEHADAANTRVSQDQLVRAPLGLLWFGGPPSEGILPRHGHGPQPQVCAGRLIIEGPDLLRALDIYTGRLLWEARLPAVGQDFDETAHQPGANASGSNYVSTPDGIYVAYGQACLRLDPATGKTISRFPLPPLPGERAAGLCRFLTVSGDYLVCAADTRPRERGVATASSKGLLVLHRHTGKLLWSATAQHGYRHNTICLGGGRLYCIDRAEGGYAWRRPASDAAPPRLLALDLKTGKTLWQTTREVFGTWLSYSARHDVLVEAGRGGRDTLHDEAAGMRAYHAAAGQVLWHNPDYGGPAMIHGDTILKDQSACHLLTGLPVLRDDPLTGRPSEWTWTRDYGCNTPLASQHLLTFRSGAAGFFDLANDGGTGNIGGFRSGCTNNLIVAGGLLTAADYTRTCTCSYQNQTSLALVPLADADMWTYYGRQEVNGVVRQLGINLGAPGNRRAENGTLWLEHPQAGGPSFQVPVKTTPAQPTCFRRHPSWVEAGDLPWVASSGAVGLTSLALDLAPAPRFPTSRTAADPNAERERSYKVRLVFVEPEGRLPGERTFDVALQGQRVLTGFDIAREAGGQRRTVIKEFSGIRVSKELTVTLAAGTGVPVLCGIEVVAEGW